MYPSQTLGVYFIRTIKLKETSEYLYFLKTAEKVILNEMGGSTQQSYITSKLLRRNVYGTELVRFTWMLLLDLV